MSEEPQARYPTQEEVAKMVMATELMTQLYAKFGFGISEAVKVALSSVAKSFDMVKWDDEDEKQRAVDYFANASTMTIQFLSTGSMPKGEADLVSGISSRTDH